MKHKFTLSVLALLASIFLFSFINDYAQGINDPYITGHGGWKSKFLNINKDGTISYHPDEQGNTIPDFSLVGYHRGLSPIPKLKLFKTLNPLNGSSDAGSMIQQAIDELSALPADKNGHRGTILLTKGSYPIAGTLHIKSDGIVLKGEGNTANGTKLIATGKGSRSLLQINGTGQVTEIPGTRVNITDTYVPTGAKSFKVTNAKAFKAGDKIILFRPGSSNWIKDIQMDQIIARQGTKQWKAEEYNLSYEREITRITGNTVFIDNPVVMAIDQKYSTGAIYKYSYKGRLQEVGVENILFESEYANDIDEDHGNIAVDFDHVENGWVSNITARFFIYAAVSLNTGAKNITVKDSKCLDAKSIITGGRRYSFNNNGQQNLFMNLETTEGRHDYVTGAKTAGPNVFYNCKSRNTHADIGPHHRWATGTLYDNIDTDGQINIQDRGNWGSGHGWSGVTQVLWNCTVESAAVQNPWASGKNYAIGLKGKKVAGRLPGKPDGEWEAQDQKDLQPASLFLAQRKAAGINIR